MRSFYLYTVFPSRHRLPFPPDPPLSSGVTTLIWADHLLLHIKAGEGGGVVTSEENLVFGLPLMGCASMLCLCTVRPYVRSGSELPIKSHREYSRQFLKLLCIFTAPSPFKTAQEHRTGQKGLPLGMTTAPGHQEISRKKQLRSH